MSAQVAPISSASGGGASGTSITLSANTATPGRHWLVGIACRAADAIASVPTGWTPVRNTVSGTSASQGEGNTYKWTGVGTPTGDQTWTFTAAAYRAAVLLELASALSVTPEVETGTTGTPGMLPSLTTVNPQALAIGFIFKNSGGTGVCAPVTPPLDYVEIIDTVSSRIGIQVCYKVFPLAGDTEVQGFTTTGFHVVQHLAISSVLTDAPPQIALEASAVTVGFHPTGIPANIATLFPDIVVTSVSGDDLFAQIIISDPAKADIVGDPPTGWTNISGGFYASSTAKPAVDVTTDLRSFQIQGVAEGQTGVSLIVTDPGDAEGLVDLSTADGVTVFVVESDQSYNVLDGDTFPFGDIQVNASLTHDFVVQSAGDADLTLDTLVLNGDSGFQLVIAENPPADPIAPAESITIGVSVLFTTLGAKTGALTIPADDPDTPFVINFTANAINPAAKLNFNDFRYRLRAK